MKKKLSFIMALVLCVNLFCSVVGAAQAVTPADSVYLNGNIYTMQSKDFSASAMAISGQKLVYVGDDEGVQPYIGDNTKVYDLEGQTVIPGIGEAHLHFSGIGTALLAIDAFWKPKEDILAAVKAEADRLPDGEWITGRGWNQEVWPDGQFPTKEELDAVAPNNPVFLVRTCGHATWANSMAIELAGITKDTPDPVGGEILRKPNGELWGIFTDTAATPIRSLMPPYSNERLEEALLLAQEQLLSYGITSAMDAGTSINNINLIKKMYEEGKLKLRMYEYVSSDEAEEYFKIGPEIDLYDGHLTVRGIKFFSDGSLGARSAWMLDDYSDRPGHVGNGRYTDDELYTLFKAAHDNGFQSAIHAIGDAANKQAIDAYESVLQESPNPNHRFRIEHFQIARLEDIERLADLGMIASMQFVHATSDKNMAEDRVGPERILGGYAWRKVLNAGAVLANGSDAPVEMVNPYHGLYAAVSRAGTSDGLPMGGWYPEETLTRYEALRAFTWGSAYAQFEEKVKGSLEVGKYADFVVIDKDYMNCAVDEIKDIEALMTVVGGEVVFEAE